jgi:hypothetical protein
MVLRQNSCNYDMAGRFQDLRYIGSYAFGIGHTVLRDERLPKILNCNKRKVVMGNIPQLQSVFEEALCPIQSHARTLIPHEYREMRGRNACQLCMEWDTAKFHHDRIVGYRYGS